MLHTHCPVSIWHLGHYQDITEYVLAEARRDKIPRRICNSGNGVQDGVCVRQGGPCLFLQKRHPTIYIWTCIRSCRQPQPKQHLSTPSSFETSQGQQGKLVIWMTDLRGRNEIRGLRWRMTTRSMSRRDVPGILWTSLHR